MIFVMTALLIVISYTMGKKKKKFNTKDLLIVLLILFTTWGLLKVSTYALIVGVVIATFYIPQKGK